MYPRAIGKCTHINGGRNFERMFWLEDLEFNLLSLAQFYGSGGCTEHTGTSIPIIVTQLFPYG